MKYERLTPKTLLSDVIKEYRICVGEPLIGTFGGHDIVELIDRLVELEDKIEAGTLVEVPKGAVVLTPEERKEKKRLADEERKRAVREFAEKLRDKEFPVNIGTEWCAVVKSRDIIDELVREVFEK